MEEQLQSTPRPEVIEADSAMAVTAGNRDYWYPENKNDLYVCVCVCVLY